MNKLYSNRKDIYKLANHKIDCKKMSKEQIAEKIINIYETMSKQLLKKGS